MCSRAVFPIASNTKPRVIITRKKMVKVLSVIFLKTRAGTSKTAMTTSAALRACSEGEAISVCSSFCEDDGSC